MKHLVTGISKELDKDSSELILEYVAALERFIYQARIQRGTKYFVFHRFVVFNLSQLLGHSDEAVVEAVEGLLTKVLGDTHIFREREKELVVDMLLQLKPLDLPQQRIICSCLERQPHVAPDYL